MADNPIPRERKTQPVVRPPQWALRCRFHWLINVPEDRAVVAEWRHGTGTSKKRLWLIGPKFVSQTQALLQGWEYGETVASPSDRLLSHYPLLRSHWEDESTDEDRRVEQTHAR